MIVGTRGSALALVQTREICDLIKSKTNFDIKERIIKTKGDKITNSQLYNMDSKGLFTKELDNVVLNEEVDFAVHSLKDVPTDLDDELEIVAIPPREVANEVLISNRDWDDLGSGNSLGSSSLRREAFCNYYDKNFTLKPLRGNVETRIKKVLTGEVDSTIMAYAGIKRLNLEQYVNKVFPLEYIYPSAGQGAIAVICRKDSEFKDVLVKLNDTVSYKTSLAEKNILKEIGVGCQWPIGVISQIENDGIVLKCILLNKNGEILHDTGLKTSLSNIMKDSSLIGKELEEYL